MTQPRMARITCRQCNGLYDSERELCDHIRMAHRSFVSEKLSLQLGTEPANIKTTLGTTKEEWAKLSGQLRNRVQARFNLEELDAIDRFILLASQGSVFDQSCK